MILFDQKSPFQRVVVIKNDEGEMHLKSAPDSPYSHTIFDSRGNPATDYAFTMASLIPKRKTGNILVLGLGGGALVKVLDNGKRQIDAVEIDPYVVEAAKLFGVRDQNNVSIFCDDGYSFVQSAPDNYYDAIMVDAYDGNSSVSWAFSDEFVDQAKAKIVQDGVILINRCKSVVPNPEVTPTTVVSVASDNEIFVIQKVPLTEVSAATDDPRKKWKMPEPAKRGKNPKEPDAPEETPKDEPKEAPQKTPETPEKPKTLTPQEAKKQAIEHIKSAKKSVDITDADIKALTDKERGELIEGMSNKAVIERLVKSIEDGDILFDLSIKYEGKNKELVTIIDKRLFDVDPDELRTSSSPTKRLRAIRLEDDLDNVAKFALNDSDPGVRAVATRRLVDEDVLSEIAIEDDNAYVSWIALSKIKDKKVLEKVALESKHDYTKKLALEKLGDSKMYEKIMLHTGRRSNNKMKRVLLDKVSDTTIYKMLKDGLLVDEFFKDDGGRPAETLDKILDKIDPKEFMKYLTSIKTPQIKMDFTDLLIENYGKIKNQKNQDKLVEILNAAKALDHTISPNNVEKLQKILAKEGELKKAA